MGLLITGSFKDMNEATYDSLYCRIDHYQLIKSLGYVATTIGHYVSKEASEPMSLRCAACTFRMRSSADRERRPPAIKPPRSLDSRS